MSPLKTALSFVEAINSANMEKFEGLMTENHTFINADASEHSGYQKMHDGWLQYFSMVPDFKIKIDDHFDRDNTIVLIGTAQGTFVEKRELKEENFWKVPAAWRVETSKGKVAIWQLFTNQEAMIKIYNRIQKSSQPY